MKSSGPVFTTQNPFKSASRVGKTHYSPSGNQYLTKKKKKTNLSPVRLNQGSTPQIRTLSPESQQPLEKRDNRCATMDGQPLYAESWPSTDCGFSPTSSIISSDTETPKKSAKAEKSFDMGYQEDSVLAKYIERFRHGRPQSREERQLMASAIREEQLPFWWMSPSSLPPSSTPSKTTDRDVTHPLKDDHRPDIFSPAVQHQSDKPLSPCKGSHSVFLDTSQGEFDDTEILHLQERASRLLLKGECTLSDGSIPVSSEGLGCSDFSSPVSVDEPVQRPLIPSLLKSTAVTAKVNLDSVQAAYSQKSVIHSLATCPEEDILFQWRLRRKMEQAREWPHSIRHASLHGPTFSRQAPVLSHPSASGQTYKQQQSTQPPEFSQNATHPDITSSQPETKESHGPCPPVPNPSPFYTVDVSDSSVSQPQTIAHFPAHMHFLCDILPCPVQSSRASAQQNIALTPDESQAKVVCKKTKFPGNSTEEPALEHVSSSPPASSGTAEGEWSSRHNKQERNRKEKVQTKESEKTEKKTGASSRKQKKKTRYSVDSEHSDGHMSTNSSSHQRLPKKVMPWRGHHQQQGTQKFPSENCTGDHGPPPSPIHSALGQVVSEVLFPSMDPSPAQNASVSLVSPPITASAPPQSPVPPCSAQNSVEVISQLLQEAEDSDEKEFEDDPLLQVLRKQRKWVKEQISEVDSMLNEFLDEQQVT